MATMSIALPDADQEFVEKQVAEGSYEDAGAYLAHLVHEDRKRKAKQHLDTLLLEGLESGEATPMTAEDWNSLHDRLKRHVEQRAKDGVQTGGGKVST